MITLILFAILFVKFDVISAECTDIYGRSVTPGIHFIPGPDPCQLCVCDNTVPKWCKGVLCSPPQNCKYFVTGSSCCDYSCLDNTSPSGELKDEMDRRFLITIATAILILTVLLFVIHKLRHRTVHSRLQNRQVNEDRRSIGFITGSIGYLDLPNGHNFDDHPLVHFPIYKPHYFPYGVAPPPYEEAVADTAFNIAINSQLTSERELQDLHQQRRRSNSTNLINSMNSVNQSRVIMNDGCICESRQQCSENWAFETTNVYNYSTQHRTIPSPMFINSENSNTQPHLECSKETASTCKNNDQLPKNHSSTTISTIRPNTCPPQFNFETSHSHLYPPQHRALPLSGSLSSPLPSTSNYSERQCQFATFSSAINISSSDGDESSVTLEPLTKQSIEFSKKKLMPLSVNGLHSHNQKDKKQNSKCVVSSKEHLSTATSIENATKDSKTDSLDNPQFIKDYHAECENCNLNVNVECDGTDEYFSEQETMTLQRKCREVSAAKSNDQSMKTSLTLPINSRTRRCSSKNRKCGKWNAKESPFKTMLEYVSSEEEETEQKGSQVL